MLQLNKFWREPLLHFLLIGAALFILFDLTREESGDPANRILVSESQVEQLAAQFKRTWLRPPTEQELSGLIESYVRDEIYYREALAMGLDRNDPQVRQRMRLKLEFLLEDLTAEQPPADEMLEAYLQQNPEKFRIAPRLSFRQVFLSFDRGQALEADAEKLLAELQAGAMAETLGDPTMLPNEQTAATERMIARSFGEKFAQAVMALEPGAWQGPLFSGFGAHLVRVTDHMEGRLPELAEIRSEVEQEYLAERRRELKELAYRKLREGYEVVIEEQKPEEDESLPVPAETAQEQAGQ
ncbi:MAG: peptidylprolyl isomerase [Gammaproteobacteria bacterium]